MSERYAMLEAWTRRLFDAGNRRLSVASEDASFRRYYRLQVDNESYIVMDAPPEHEDCAPFIDVARRLSAAGLHVPRVFEADLERGFLLLSDLGSRCYFDVLDEPSTGVDELYQDALTALVRMQVKADREGLPAYDRAKLRTELELFPNWFLERHLGLTLDSATRSLLDEIFECLCSACEEQPQVFVHRDYHSRNLMVAGSVGGSSNPGIIDFQDAVVGPFTYDLISLCRDVYVDWSGVRVENWTQAFRRQVLAAEVCDELSSDRLNRWFVLTAAQRLLKIAGIFCRLFHRDGKARYLGDLPLTLKHLRRVCNAGRASSYELGGLLEIMDTLNLERAVEQASGPRNRGRERH